MAHFGFSRLLGGALLAIGIAAGTGGVVISGAAAAAAGTLCPSGSAPVVCVSPSSGVINHQVVTVVVRGPANTEVAVTECNPNLLANDSNACDNNPADLNKAGGPALAMTNGSGKAVLQYKVRVSSTKPVGDGNCLAGGDSSGVACFLVAASVSTQTQIANPRPFSTQ